MVISCSSYDSSVPVFYILYSYGITHTRMVIPSAYDDVAHLKLLLLSHYREGKAYIYSLLILLELLVYSFS